MKEHETQKPTADARIASQARTWRRAEKLAIGEKTEKAKRAQHHELQKLREVVDTHGGR
jgi:hypothetical protein